MTEGRKNGNGGEELPPVSYQAVFRAAPDGIIIVDRSGTIREANPQAARLFGYAREELLGSKVEKLVPPSYRERHPQQRAHYHENPEERPMGIGLQLRGVRKDGRQMPVEVCLSPFQTDEGEFVIAVVRDISERDRLRRLGAGTLQAVEEERRRIARELHDDTAQRLAALLVRLGVLRRTADPLAREELLVQLHEQLAEAVEGVRQISRGLRPPALEDVGLETAIRSYLRSFLDGVGLEMAVEVEPVAGLLSLDAQLMVYRVIQEAVSNVVRHARAGSARVQVKRTGPEVEVIISDDGRGFDPEDAFLEGAFLEKGGLGLVGMDERARLVGGALTVRSVPGEGTRIHLRIPIEKGGEGG
jgi:PAS domain S-box-containing protein